MAKANPKVVVFVRGGMVQGAISTSGKVDLLIVDFDNEGEETGMRSQEGADSEECNMFEETPMKDMKRTRAYFKEYARAE